MEVLMDAEMEAAAINWRAANNKISQAQKELRTAYNNGMNAKAKLRKLVRQANERMSAIEISEKYSLQLSTVQLILGRS